MVGLLFPALLAAQGDAKCGSARWPVKTLTDLDKDSVSFEATPTSVSAMVALPVPRETPAQSGRLAIERRTFRVRAILVARRTESDGDIHLILADPADRSRTLVAEIPDSTCANGTRYASDFAQAVRDVNELPDGLEVEVTGVAFWDDDHGQFGNAANGIELHPVIGVSAVLTKNDILQELVGAAPVGPSDVRVWLNTSSRIYHCPGSPNYGTTARGQFMPESAALRAGARPAAGRRCR